MESGAGNEIRTRDPNLGKVVLYQLSYSRVEGSIIGIFRMMSTLPDLTPARDEDS